MSRAQTLKDELTSELADLCLAALKEAGFGSAGNDQLRERLAEAIADELHLWRTA